MSSLTERLLYITLLLVFIIAGITAYVAISFGEKLNTQLKAATELNKKQTETIKALEKNQEELKSTALKNTLYLECIINLHGKGLAPDEGRCRIESAELAPATSNYPVMPKTTNPVASPSPSPAPTSTRPGNSSSARGIGQSIRDTINNLIGRGK